MKKWGRSFMEGVTRLRDYPTLAVARCGINFSSPEFLSEIDSNEKAPSKLEAFFCAEGLLR